MSIWYDDVLDIPTPPEANVWDVETIADAALARLRMQSTDADADRVTAAAVVATYLLATYATFGVIGAALFGFGVGVAVERGQGWMLLKRASMAASPAAVGSTDSYSSSIIPE